MTQAIQRRFEQASGRLAEAAAGLHALSPLAVLGRGYALVRRKRDGQIVRGATELAVGDLVDARFATGHIEAEVTLIGPDEDPV